MKARATAVEALQAWKRQKIIELVKNEMLRCTSGSAESTSYPLQDPSATGSVCMIAKMMVQDAGSSTVEEVEDVRDSQDGIASPLEKKVRHGSQEGGHATGTPDSDVVLHFTR
ncbi:MAG: hypothetical protein Q9216_001166 [Gyalolechia sp. 2 TL-2023]